MFRVRMNSVYDASGISAVVWLKPVHGTKIANRASEGIV